MTPVKTAWRLGLAAAPALLAACAAVGPDYHKPAVEMPVTWKLEAPWRTGTPSDGAPKGPWWERFGDAKLNGLEGAALAGNQTLAAAGGRLEQARAALAGASGAQYPALALGA